MTNQPITLPEITLTDNAETRVWVVLQHLDCDLYARSIRFKCEVYTLLKASGFQSIAPAQFWVTNTSYRVPVVNTQGVPLLDTDGSPLTIGNFDYIYAAYFEQFQLRQAAQGAMGAEFTKTANPITYVRQ